MTQAVPITFGRYQIDERLAVGGMAELFRGRVVGAHGFQKPVVIKRILPHLAADPSFVSMFIDEANLTARLDHPKIAQVFELGVIDNQLFIAMEFVDGCDLRAVLTRASRQGTRIPPPIAAWVAHELLDALGYAHGLTDDQGTPLGVMHRDISPSNVLLSWRGDVKLADFGIARAMEQPRKTQAGIIKGKYHYLSPEQVNGTVNPDARADLFAVGVVLGELLTGRRVFKARSELELLVMVRDARTERFDEFAAHVDPDLQAIVHRALMREPAERYQSAVEFSAALADWLFGHRIRIGPSELAAYLRALFEGAELEAAEAASSHDGRILESVPRLPPPPRRVSGIHGIVAPPSRPPPLPLRVAVNGAPTIEIGLDGVEVMLEEAAASVSRAEVTEVTPAFEHEDSPGVLFDLDRDDVPAPPRPFAPPPEIARTRTNHIAIPLSTSVDRIPLLPSDPRDPYDPNRPDEAGDLIVTSATAVLHRLALDGATALVVVQHGTAERSVYLVDGKVSEVRSNVAKESLDAYLERTGVISDIERSLALAMLPRFGHSLPHTLVELGVLDAARLAEPLRRHTQGLLIDMLSPRPGHYRLYAPHQSSVDRFPLAVDLMETLGLAARSLPEPYLEEWARPSLLLAPLSVPGALSAMRAFGYGLEAIRLCERLDGRAPLRDHLSRQGEPAERVHLLTLLHLLADTGLVLFS